MEWKASWIWVEPCEEMDNLYLYARREIAIEQAPGQASIFVTAGSLYKLYINGQYVGRGPNPSDPSRYYYDVYGVSAHLRPGANAIAAVCYNYGPETRGILGQNWGRGGFLMELRDGREGNTLLATDGGWRVFQAPPWDQDTPVNCTLLGDFKETYDSRQEISGWMEPGFDDSTWPVAHVLGPPPIEPYTRLVEREIPFLGGERVWPVDAFWESASVTYAWRDDWETYHEARLVPSRRASDKSGKPCEVRKTHDDFDPALIFDFGRIVTGYPEIAIRDSQGGVTDVLYGESLNLTRVDRFVLKGGPQVLQPYNRRTFRYLKLLFRETPGPVLLDDVSLELNTYPVRYLGSFACSDPLLNRIWEVGRYTMHLSMLDHFVDCPWRERTIYGGDVYVENLIALYAFGDPRMSRKVLRQMFAIQHESGAVPPYGPYHGCDSFYPAWSAYLGLALLDYYRLTGDRDLLEELWPNLVRLLDWAVRQMEQSEAGLIGTPAKRCLYDEWERAPKVTYKSWVNLPFRRLFEEAAAAAAFHRIGREGGQAKEEFSLHGEIRKQMDHAILSRLYTSRRGLCRSAWPRPGHRETQADTALALWSGAVSWVTEGAGKSTSSLAARRMMEPGVPKIGGPFNGFFVVEGLYRAGEAARALEFIRTYWGDMLARGATTFWEHFSLDWPPGIGPDRGVSRCHGWSAGPTYSLPARVLGVIVDVRQPAFPMTCVAPEPGDLQCARGAVPTPNGLLRVVWQRTDTEFHMDVDVPEGMKVNVLPPDTGLHSTVATDGGKPEPRRPHKRTGPMVGPGRHEIVCK